MPNKFIHEESHSMLKNVTTVYQPIYCMNSKEVWIYEALGRVKYENKVIMPNDFLPIFKSKGQYVDYSTRYMDNVFKLLNFDQNIKISINVSMLDIDNVEWLLVFYNNCQNLVNKSRLWVELLETEYLQKIKTLAFINKLKAIGVTIVLDDFGSGYSNLNYFVNYPIDILKIDGSLIKNIKNSKVRNILHFIDNISKDHRIKTVAEHIETEEIFNEIQMYSIDFLQGFFLGKPKEITQTTKY